MATTNGTPAAAVGKTTLVYTPVAEISKIHAQLQATFAAGKLRPIAYRKYQLTQLGYMLKDNEARFAEALASDLGRPAFESGLFDIGPSLTDVGEALAGVDKWSKTEKPPFALNFAAMRPTIRKEPKGVVLIISPFNYPVWLSLGPLSAALAAGCPAVLKPSEQTPATSSLLAELVAKYLDPEVVRVVNGAVEETTELIKHPWGHLLYTGSGRVAKIIGVAAAKTLTPTTLELGGKSPVFIDPNTDMDLAAKRLLWGKAVNAGQTCIAPDYVLVPRESQDKLVESLKEAHKSFYPPSSAHSIEKPGVYGRLVTPQAFSRVSGLLKNTQGTVVIGGKVDEQSKFIEPTIVKDVGFGDSLMTEEIFGPVLPLVPIDSLEEGLKYVNANDHPLALYVFTGDAKYKENVFSNTLSGAAVANEQIIHPGVHGLPFGGIGPSGSGYHTGKYGFDIFTHLRASIDTPSWVDKVLGFRYPPYTDKNINRMKMIVSTKLPPRPTGPPSASDARWFGNSKWFILAVVAALGELLRRQGRLGTLLGRG